MIEMPDETQAHGEQRPETTTQQIAVDRSSLIPFYANWFQATVTPEELIVDFALNPEHTQQPTQPIKLTHRMVLSLFTAKRLLAGLQYTISRHEHLFGMLETDPQKRLRPGVVPPPPR
jgi:hypothetical protein